MRLRTTEVLDLLERTWQHMDTGLRKALRLDDSEKDLNAAIEEVCCLQGNRM